MVRLVGNSNYSGRTNNNKVLNTHQKFTQQMQVDFSLRTHIQLNPSTQSAVIENDFDNSNMLRFYIDSNKHSAP